MFLLITIVESIQIGICFLLVLTLSKRLRLLPLTLFLFALALHMLHNIVSSSFHYPLPQITHLFSFLYGPLFYLFIYYLTHEFHGFQKQHLLHFIPALVFFPVRFISPDVETFVHFAALISIAAYLGSCFYVIHRFQRIMSDTHSNDLISLLWLKRLLVLICLVGVIEFLAFGLPFSPWQLPPGVSHLVSAIVLLFFVATIAIKAIDQADIFDGISKQDEVLSDAIKQQTNSNTCAHLDLEQGLNDLKQALQTNQVFLDSNLTVSQLAKISGYSARDVSNIINQTQGMNFNEYINSIRIAHACNLLCENQSRNTSILDVMLQSGFNSKSSFYTAFKKQTGQTPNQYRQTLIK